MPTPTEPGGSGAGERGSAEQPLSYHVCPRCLRATPSAAGEKYCPNDGSPMLTACPRCAQPILAPYGEYCANCGTQLVTMT